MSNEPAVVLGVLTAALTAVQQAAIPMPVWAHTLLACALVILGSVAVRGQVTPA